MNDHPDAAPAANNGAAPAGPRPKRPLARRLLTSVPVLVVVGLAALYFLVMLVGVPYGGRWYLEKTLTETLAAPCEVASLKCNPFTLRTEVGGVRLPYPPKSGAGEFLSFKSLVIQPAVWEMIKTFTPNLGAVIIDEPRISAGVLENGELSLATYPFGQTDDAPAKPADPGEPFGFTVTDIEVKNGSLSLWDRRNGVSQAIDDIYIHIPLVSSVAENRDKPVAPVVRATIDGSPVTANASSTVFANQINSSLELDLGRIPIEQFRAYIAPYTSLILQKAAISTILSLQAGYVGDDKHFDISVKGTLNLFDVNVLDPAGRQSVLALNRGQLVVERFLLRPQDVNIHDLTLDGLTADVTLRKDGTLNWQGYFGAPAAPAKKAAGPAPSGPDAPASDAPASEATGPKTAGKDAASAAPKAAAPQAPPKTAPHPANPAASLPPIILNKLTVTNARIGWHDETVGMHHTFGPLQASVTNFSTRSGKPASFTLAMKDDLLGTVNVSGDYNLATSQASLDTRLDGLSLPGFAPYLKALPITLEKGLFSTHLTTRLDLAQAMPVRQAAGKLGLRSLALKDGSLWGAQIKDIAIDDLAFVNEPLSLTIASLTVDGPHGTFVLKPDKKTQAQTQKELAQLSQQIKEQEKAKAKAAEAAAKESAKNSTAQAKSQGASPLAGVDSQLAIFKKLAIGKVAVKNGSFSFTDERVTPPTKGQVSQVNLALDGLSNAPGSHAKLNMNGLFDRAPFSVRGTVNPLKAPLNATMRLELDGLNMINLSPFLVQALAYPIKSGLFTAELDVTFKNDVMDSTNHFILENFDLGPRQNVPGAADLPLPLAVALLKGPSGTIDLTVNADGRLDDPQFSVAGIVLKILGNIMYKVVASPFTLVAGLFGSDSSSTPDLQYVHFAPGVSVVNNEARANLQALASLLEKRPALNVLLTGMAAPEDRAGVADAWVLQQMRALKYKELSAEEREKIAPDEVMLDRAKNPDEFARLLYDVYNKSDLKVARNFFGTADKKPVDEMLAAFRNAMQPDEAALSGLARARAEAALKALIGIKASLAGRAKVNNDVLIDGKTAEELVPGARLDLAPAM